MVGGGQVRIIVVGADINHAGHGFGGIIVRATNPTQSVVLSDTYFCTISFVELQEQSSIIIPACCSTICDSCIVPESITIVISDSAHESS